jgi:hypothetical protein
MGLESRLTPGMDGTDGRIKKLRAAHFTPAFDFKPNLNKKKFSY